MYGKKADGMKDEYEDVIAELVRMQERIRTLRARHCDSVASNPRRYRAFSGAVADLNVVIGELQKERAARA